MLIYFLLLKSYHHFLFHLLTKSLNLCVPLLINNVISTQSHLLPKQVSASILPITTTILNVSLSTGTFPIDFNHFLLPHAHKTIPRQTLTFSKQSFVSCSYHIRDLRRIRHTLDLKTVSVIATSLVHFKLDYCYSYYLNLPQKLISRLQLRHNSLARTVTRNPKTEHIPLYSYSALAQNRRAHPPQIISRTTLSITATTIGTTTHLAFTYK